METGTTLSTDYPKPGQLIAEPICSFTVLLTLALLYAIRVAIESVATQIIYMLGLTEATLKTEKNTALQRTRPYIKVLNSGIVG
jgi:hypothetical protein